ncbi:hypothetical protein [Anaerotignum neopropionicum]|uniref:hypothetical protein n=1 Tax=Anaerotignum neopropionicum TaxID=36847 RepID=UPI0012FE52BE|nr:hypothetical protein [Anaerotignum neopropionicum]
MLQNDFFTAFAFGAIIFIRALLTIMWIAFEFTIALSKTISPPCIAGGFLKLKRTTIITTSSAGGLLCP